MAGREHYVRPENAPEPLSPLQPKPGFWSSLLAWFGSPVGDVEHENYSASSPRLADGRRTRIFFFNGNGSSR